MKPRYRARPKPPLNKKQAERAIYRRGWRCEPDGRGWRTDKPAIAGIWSLRDACALEGLNAVL